MAAVAHSFSSFPDNGIYFILLCGLLYLYHFRASSKNLPLPPGPRAWFLDCIFGVKYQIPTSVPPWKVYAEWARTYGGSLLSFRIFNRRILILNDFKSVHDLLNKRANIYSDRPRSWMYHDLCGRKNSVFNVSSLDDRHKAYRKILQTGLGPRAIQQYAGLMESEARILVDGLTLKPQDYETHIRRNAAAVIMKVAFGYTISRTDDKFIKVAEEASQISGWALTPGRWLVDYYPIVRFIPRWFPGASFRRQAAIWRHKLESLSSVPHQWVKEQMASGNYTESFTSRLLKPEDEHIVSPQEEDIIKWCAGGLYAGAADTTVSCTISFIMLMALHPDVQERARAEVDQVLEDRHLPRVGDPHLLPQIGDLPRFRYLLAVLKEVLRWAPVGNLLLPHRVIQDDEYLGYRIPKDTTIIANVWAIMHDETMYPDPFRFDPDRFMPCSEEGLDCHYGRGLQDDIQPDPRTFGFGFGRRACPGVQFAETTMLLTMATILFNFDINRPSDEPMAEVEFTPGFTSHIKPFNVRITRR